jgi:hypothetical protein
VYEEDPVVGEEGGVLQHVLLLQQVHRALHTQPYQRSRPMQYIEMILLRGSQYTEVKLYKYSSLQMAFSL